MRRFRVVVDAMYLARAFAGARSGSPSESLIEAWARGEVSFVLSGRLVAEVEVALAGIGARQDEIDEIVALLCSFPSDFVQLRHQKMGCSDPNDDHLLEAAITGHARWIVSEDRAVLDLPRQVNTFLRSYHVETIDIHAFLDVLEMVRNAPEDAIFTFDLSGTPFSCLRCDHPDHADCRCGAMFPTEHGHEECECQSIPGEMELAG